MEEVKKRLDLGGRERVESGHGDLNDMAKLSAYGQQEIWRVQHPETKLKYAAMSNGRVLKYTYHWMVVKLKPEYKDLEVLKAYLLTKGYVLVNR